MRDMLLSAAGKQVRRGLREGSHCGPSTGSNAEHQHADRMIYGCRNMHYMFYKCWETRIGKLRPHLGWKVNNTQVVLDNEGLAALGDVVEARA